MYITRKLRSSQILSSLVIMLSLSLFYACGEQDSGESFVYASEPEYGTSGRTDDIDYTEASAAGEMSFDDSFDEGSPSSNTQGQGSARSLTAGLWDDNVYPEHYQSYAETNASRDLSDLPVQRQIIKVVNREGAPLRGVDLVLTSGEVLTTLKSIDDGRALFAPGLDGDDQAEIIEISARLGDERTTVNFDRSELGGKPWVITLDQASSMNATKLEVALVIDATGSMSDEISFLKAEFAEMIRQIQRTYPHLEVRLALTHYRDQGDDYVTRSSDFTSDIEAFQNDLDEVIADGGGDFPEAMGEAMIEVMGLNWSQEANVSRLVFIAADAPPHSGRQERVDDAAIVARSLGARIFPIASSGVDTQAEWVMRQAAAFSLGQYIFLTDDSGFGDSHAEPHIPCYRVRLLQDQLKRVIENSVTGQETDMPSEDVIRSVGFDENGSCISLSESEEEPVEEQINQSTEAETPEGD